jgi:hypothetical protein
MDHGRSGTDKEVRPCRPERQHTYNRLSRCQDRRGDSIAAHSPLWRPGSLKAAGLDFSRPGASCAWKERDGCRPDTIRLWAGEAVASRRSRARREWLSPGGGSMETTEKEDHEEPGVFNIQKEGLSAIANLYPACRRWNDGLTGSCHPVRAVSYPPDTGDSRAPRAGPEDYLRPVAGAKAPLRADCASQTHLSK